MPIECREIHGVRVCHAEGDSSHAWTQALPPPRTLKLSVCGSDVDPGAIDFDTLKSTYKCGVGQTCNNQGSSNCVSDSCACTPSDCCLFDSSEIATC